MQNQLTIVDTAGTMLAFAATSHQTEGALLLLENGIQPAKIADQRSP